MLTSSGTYTFQSIRAELLIREAFELIGIPGSLVVAEQLEGAKRSINFLLTDLVNQNVNLWTLKQMFLPLNKEQTSYSLPSELIKVIQVNLRNSIRELDAKGVSLVSLKADNTPDGIVAGIFDDTSTIPCTQTEINGWIQYGYETSRKINFLGIKSNTEQSYTITLSGSKDGGNWADILTIPTSTYFSGNTRWFDVYNINEYLYYRITEKGGKTLDIIKIYFNDRVIDTTLSEVTNYAYLKMPMKNNIGRPTIFSIDYQITPSLNIWQAPDLQYNCLVISYQSMIESLSSYTESLNVPNAFYQAIVYGLAKSLAMKYAPDKLQFIGPEFDRALSICLTKNTNTLPLNFRPYVN